MMSVAPGIHSCFPSGSTDYSFPNASIPDCTNETSSGVSYIMYIFVALKAMP